MPDPTRASAPARCSKRFAHGRLCRRLRGHRGKCATRLTMAELRHVLGIRNVA